MCISFPRKYAARVDNLLANLPSSSSAPVVIPTQSLFQPSSSSSRLPATNYTFPVLDPDVDCPNIRFFELQEWSKYKKSKANSTAPHDLGYLQDRNGTYSIESKPRMNQFWVEAKSVWNMLYMLDLDPRTWQNDVANDIGDFFYGKMASSFEEF
jgi:hypothetical protein